jgi:hypothetical protein
MAEKAKKDAAQAESEKARRAKDAVKAMADYEAEAVATRAKTARLRALRLAREAELAAAQPPAATKTKSARKKKSAASGTLSDWLDGETKAGRRA